MNGTIGIMIEKGATASEYVKSYTKTILLGTNPLRKVNDSIYDYIENGTLHVNVDKIVYDGTNEPATPYIKNTDTLENGTVIYCESSNKTTSVISDENINTLNMIVDILSNNENVTFEVYNGVSGIKQQQETNTNDIKELKETVAHLLELYSDKKTN